mmetsp:Transcript_23510/g.37888  ORF Transcript_23510/g.37888 Transcript_23510/m.37888 type:complete len:120 (+) Transcript_23510:123-482(+)
MRTGRKSRECVTKCSGTRGTKKKLAMTSSPRQVKRKVDAPPLSGLRNLKYHIRTAMLVQENSSGHISWHNAPPIIARHSKRQPHNSAMIEMTCVMAMVGHTTFPLLAENGEVEEAEAGR